MRAIGFWLLVVRLAVGVLFMLQLTSSGASARATDGASHGALSGKDRRLSQQFQFQETSKLVDGSWFGQDIAEPASSIDDTSAVPSARSCGVRASRFGGVVRLAGGFDSGALARPASGRQKSPTPRGKGTKRVTDGRKSPVLGNARIHPSENAATETWPKLPSDLRCALASSARTGASRRRDFAGGRETSCTLVAEQAAHLGARFQRETNERTSGESAAPSQPGEASRQLNRREDGHSSPVNAGGPRRDRRGETRALQGRAARSARRAHNAKVAGSNPVSATLATVRLAARRSGDGGKAALRERTARPVPGNVLQDMWGSNPHRAATPKPGVAKQQESASRLASVAMRATGSTAAAVQPAPIGGAV